MTKQQKAFIGIFLLLLIITFLFTKTYQPKKHQTSEGVGQQAPMGSFDALGYLREEIAHQSDDSAAVAKEMANSFNHDAIGWLLRYSSTLQRPDLVVLLQDTLQKLHPNDSLANETADNFLLVGSYVEQANPIRAYMLNRSIAIYNQLLAKKPDDESVSVGKGRAIMELNDGQSTMEGVQLLLSVVNKNPDNVEAQLALAKFGIVSGQFEKAITRLEKVLYLQPENLEALFMLSEAYEKSGDNVKAVEVLKKCLPLIDDEAFKVEIKAYIDRLNSSN